MSEGTLCNIMKKFYIYKHKYKGEVRQYFVARGQRVYFEIHKWLGKILTKGDN